jgi:clan AA aspartic protease
MVTDTDITLKNGTDVDKAQEGRIKADEVRQMTVKAIVDTGAWTLVINEETRNKLGLLDKGYGEATLADGQEGEFPMAGPLEVWWEKRYIVMNALVLPNAPDVLLGAYPLEGLDLTINPKRGLVGIHGDIVRYRV